MITPLLLVFGALAASPVADSVLSIQARAASPVLVGVAGTDAEARAHALDDELPDDRAQVVVIEVDDGQAALAARMAQTGTACGVLVRQDADKVTHVLPLGACGASAPLETTPTPTSPATPAAGTLVIFPFRTVNVTPQQALAAREIVRMQWNTAGDRPVFSEAATLLLISAPADDVAQQAACAKVGCDRYLSTDYVGLGNDVLVGMVLHDGSGLALARYEGRLAGMDDAPAFFDQAVRSLAGQATPITRHNVTAVQTRAENRLWAEDISMLGTGVWMPVGARDSAVVVGTVRQRYLQETWFFDLAGTLALPIHTDSKTNFGGAYADVGGGVFFREDGPTGYVALAAGPRLLAEGDDFGIGFGGALALGAWSGFASSIGAFGEIRFGLDACGDVNAAVAGFTFGVRM